MGQPVMRQVGVARSRPVRAAAVAAVTVVALGVAASGAGAATHGKGARRVVHAAAAFAAQESSRMSGSISIDVTSANEAGVGLDMPFTAAIDNTTRSGSFSFDMSDLGVGGSGKVEAVMTDGAVYMNIANLDSKIEDELHGKTWVKIDSKDLGTAGQLQQSDPSSALDGLRGVSSDTREVGHATVRGVDTVHYRGTLDVDKAVAKAPEAARDRVRGALSQFDDGTRLDVWIDANGLPQRYSLSADIVKDSQRATMVESFDIYDYGVQVDVKVPPASQTATYSELEAAQHASRAS
jgi:hypothetical protein